MAVLAIFRYEVKPGRTGDFIEKLQKAAGPEFHSEVMPKGVRIFRSAVPGSGSRDRVRGYGGVWGADGV
jgi:hypothetical protein